MQTFACALFALFHLVFIPVQRSESSDNIVRKKTKQCVEIWSSTQTTELPPYIITLNKHINTSFNSVSASRAVPFSTLIELACSTELCSNASIYLEFRDRDLFVYLTR